MLQTYRAILVKDRVEWQDEAPTHERPVRVHVTVLDHVSESEPAGSRGDAMAAALQKIADAGGLPAVNDPVGWQRDVREDRPLPGRGE